MKRILPVLLTIIVSLFAFTANAQWVPITHTSGTQAYGGVSVTVSNVAGTTGGGCGGFYWVPGTNASYTFTFSTPVAGIWIMVDAINTGETIEFIIDNQFFPITNCNLDPNPFVNNCSVNNCNIVNGQFVNNTTGWVCGGIMTFYGPISSFTINQPVGGSGTTFNISFAPMGSNIGGSGTVTAGSNSPVCAGGVLNLTATVTGGPYSWTGPNGFTSTQQNPTINPVTLNDGGNYIVTSIGPCGVVIDTVTVVVNAPPTVASSSSTDPTTCGGSDGTIVLNGLPPNQPFVVTFDLNGNPVSVNVVSNANGTIIVTGLTQGSYTTISVLSGNCPPVVVGNMTLTDPPLPAAPVAASNSPVCENGTLAFTANTVPNGIYNWSGPGFSSVLQNPSITNVQLTSTGNYSVTVTVNNCVSPATIVPVTITPLPAPPITTNIDYCQFDVAVPLTANGTALLWYTSQTGTGSSVAPTPNTSTAGVTTYWVTQTQNSCESPQASMTVTIKPKPQPPVYTGPVHFCRDDASAPLTANGQNIQWYDAVNAPLTSAPTPVTTVPGDYTWYVTQSVNGCESDKTTVVVHVADIPPAPGVVDVKQCQFDAQMPLTATGQNLQWYNTLTGGPALISAPIPATNAPLVRTWFVSQTVDGCESPRSPITVTVHFLPTSTFVPSRPLVCENDTLAFYYTGNGTVSETYTWTLPSDSAELISGTTNSQGPIVIRFDSIGTFPLVLNVDNQGCNTTYTYNVKVVVVPVVTISMPNDICIYDSVKIGLGGYNSTIASYVWDFDNGTNVYNNINEGPYQIQWDGTGLKTISVTVSNTACETTTLDTVLIHNVPDASFAAAAGTAICIGDSVRLAALDNNGLFSYEWAPERFFNQSNNFAPVVNAYLMSNEAITLTVSTPYGCVASKSMLLDPQQCCVVSLPNVFSPNGDGKNDIFRPITTGTHSIKLFMIVNRWGQKVFETLDENIGWDGTFNGVDQNIDTYYYILQYKCNGKTQEMKGEVILVR